MCYKDKEMEKNKACIRNKFNSDTQRYFSKIENFSKRFLSII